MKGLKDIPIKEKYVALAFGLINCICYFAVQLLLFLIKMSTDLFPAYISVSLVGTIGIIFGYISGRHLIDEERTYSTSIAFKRGMLIGCLSLLSYLVVLYLLVPLAMILLAPSHGDVISYGLFSQIHDLLRFFTSVLLYALPVAGWIVVLLSGAGSIIIYKARNLTGASS